MVWRGIKGSAGRLAVALLAVFAGAATAQSWPAKPLKFVMTAPAGSSIDVIGRILGDKLKDTLRQPVVESETEAKHPIEIYMELAKRLAKLEPFIERFNRSEEHTSELSHT